MSGFRTVTSGRVRDGGKQPQASHGPYQGVEKMIVIRLLDFARRPVICVGRALSIWKSRNLYGSHRPDARFTL